MIEKINELYSLQKKDVPEASQVLSRAFKDDPMWSLVIDNDAEKLALTFYIPLLFSLRYGMAYATSENLEGISVWLSDKYADMPLPGIFRSGAIFPALKMGRKTLNRIDKVFKPLKKDRKENIKPPYLYLYILGVDTENQKKGYSSNLLRAMFKKTDKKGIPLYLETETESNVEIYEHFGFQLIKKITLPEINVPMWEMIRYPR